MSYLRRTLLDGERQRTCRWRQNALLGQRLHVHIVIRWDFSGWDQWSSVGQWRQKQIVLVKLKINQWIIGLWRSGNEKIKRNSLVMSWSRSALRTAAFSERKSCCRSKWCHRVTRSRKWYFGRWPLPARRRCSSHSPDPVRPIGQPVERIRWRRFGRCDCRLAAGSCRTSWCRRMCDCSR